jgi:hypothetical protein
MFHEELNPQNVRTHSFNGYDNTKLHNATMNNNSIAPTSECCIAFIQVVLMSVIQWHAVQTEFQKNG